MKSFKWTLQRLLDVTAQRERAARSELLSVSREQAAARQDLARRQAVLRMLLAELGRQPLELRLASQETFMQTSAVAQRRIEQLHKRLIELAADRDRATAALLKTRSRRQTLERLRQEAFQRHLRQEAVLEQKQFDDRAQVAFARRSIAMRTAEAPHRSDK